MKMNNPRKEFVSVNTIQEAADKCPWAMYILQTGEGYWCFESHTDYKNHINPI
jgi:hypothetical protein